MQVSNSHQGDNSFVSTWFEKGPGYANNFFYSTNRTELIATGGGLIFNRTERTQQNTKITMLFDDPPVEALLPPATVTQQTTQISQIGSRKATTLTQTFDYNGWTTIDFGTTTIPSPVARQVTSTVQTVLTNTQPVVIPAGTSTFVTYTDPNIDQVIVAHTIYEDPKGFLFYTFGSPLNAWPYSKGIGADSMNTGWVAETNAVLSSATRTTFYYVPFYQGVATVTGDISNTQAWNNNFISYYYEIRRQDFLWAGGREDTPITATRQIKNVLIGFNQAFPWTTSSEPPGWVDYENDYGELVSWEGFPIHKANTLESVRSSRAGNFIPGEFSTVGSNGSYSSSYESSSPDGEYLYRAGHRGGINGNFYMPLPNRISHNYGEFSYFQTWDRNDPKPQIIEPRFPQSAFASPELIGDGQSTFSTVAYFLKMPAQVTINSWNYAFSTEPIFAWGDFVAPQFSEAGNPFATSILTGLNQPFIQPTWTGIARASTLIPDSEYGHFWEYETETSKFTSVSVSREGESISSSWSWQTILSNATITTTQSGVNLFVTVGEMETDADITPRGNDLQGQTVTIVGDHVKNDFVIVGGAYSPHQTYTAVDYPHMAMVTVYDASGSSTSSINKMAFSQATTRTFSGDGKISIISYIGAIQGYGLRTVNWFSYIGN